MNEFNSIAFTPDEVAEGFLEKFLGVLLDFNNKNQERYHDIHITTDGFCTIVEWVTRPYDDSCAGKFKFVGEAQFIATEVVLPNGDVKYAFSKEEEREIIENYNQTKDQCDYNEV